MKNSKLKSVQGRTFFSDGIHAAAEKTVLNVSKIRLRLIFSRALYLLRLFAKALEEHLYPLSIILNCDQFLEVPKRAYPYIQSCLRISLIRSQ